MFLLNPFVSSVQGSKFIFGFGSTSATRCNLLGAEFKILGAQLQMPVASTLYSKRILNAPKKATRASCCNMGLF